MSIICLNTLGDHFTKALQQLIVMVESFPAAKPLRQKGSVRVLNNSFKW